MGFKPNEKQDELIKSTQGIYLVDAGPGTGKTVTLTSRYTYLLGKGIEPDDILLITFTRNAADQMKEKIINKSDYSQAKLRDAPINTFHGYCKGLVESYGFDAPDYLGIDDSITSTTKIIENEIVEERKFGRFMDQFKDRHPEYSDFYMMVYDRTNLLRLIKSLASKGIVPVKDGWYRNGETYLNGSLDKFKEVVKKLNRPREGKRGPKNSELMGRLYSYKNCCLTEDAPSDEDVRGGRNKKKVDWAILKKAFDEDREDLKDFVHDIYFEYIEYALSKNYLNFNFYLLFAFVLLCEDVDVIEENGFGYVMVDEFQDTNEIQLKIAMLLSDEGNISVVGDWKQSIYSFQYATVENILSFEERLMKYKDELNEDTKRITYPVENVTRINLVENYRSTQDIIDFSEGALTLRANQYENIQRNDILRNITSLKSNTESSGLIEVFHSHEEIKAILDRIQRIVGNPEYTIEKDDEERMLTYNDIAVLSRTRKFGLDLQRMSREFGVPAAYEGGIELFETDPAVLLLAWLRIVEYKHSRRGWAVVLEESGYSLDEVKYILDEEDYPESMLEFRKGLGDLDDISSLARSVFRRYGIDDPFSGKIIEVLRNTFRSSYMNLGDIVHFIEENIDSGKVYEVDSTTDQNVVTLQTIHSAKGLEYPVVFISDVNSHRFPGRGRGGGRIQYDDPIGIRQKKVFVDGNMPYLYDNWRMEILSRCLDRGYDEERRLMYVAMTRAEKFLFVTADTERKSQFFKDLDFQKREVKPDIDRIESVGTEVEKFKIDKKSGKSLKSLPVKSVMEDREGTGRGKDFGTSVHVFARRYAEEGTVQPQNPDERNVKELLDSLDGDLLVERECRLPLNFNGDRIVLIGNIDLVSVGEDEVLVVDYKTERSKPTEKEYIKQLSVYYHVVDSRYAERKVRPCIYYTEEGKLEEIEPHTLDQIKSYIDF